MTTTTELTITKPGIYPGIPDAVYHADPVPGGSLSSSGARDILDSPARFAWKRGRLITSAEFDVGHATHARILGAGMEVVQLDFASWQTKAAREARDAVYADGKTPLLAKDFAPIVAMSEAVLAHPKARALLEQPGESEISAFAPDPETGVWLRARLDRLNASAAIDVKTTTGSASPSGFGSTAAKYGYPIQEAHYLDTLEWVTGERPPLLWIVVEKREPHLVAVHEFDDITRIAARDLAARARRIYAECKASGEWPGYSDEVITTQLPGWWLDQTEDQDEMEVA